MPLTSETFVLAVDPGSEESAWVLYDYAAKRIVDFGKEENAVVLRRVRSNWCRRLAVEMIASYGMAVGREVFETCVWIGRFIEAHGGQATRIFRREVKLELCDSPRANDSTVRTALIDMFGPAGSKKAPGPTYGISKDVWAALGVAVTWAILEARNVRQNRI